MVTYDKEQLSCLAKTGNKNWDWLSIVRTALKLINSTNHCSSKCLHFQYCMNIKSCSFLSQLYRHINTRALITDRSLWHSCVSTSTITDNEKTWSCCESGPLITTHGSCGCCCVFVQRNLCAPAFTCQRFLSLVYLRIRSEFPSILFQLHIKTDERHGLVQK